MTNYPTIYSNINLLTYAQIVIRLNIILNLFLQQLVSDVIFTWKITLYGVVLKSEAFVRTAADEKRLTILQYLRNKENTRIL
jgi:hypothetical protein